MIAALAQQTRLPATRKATIQPPAREAPALDAVQLSGAAAPSLATQMGRDALATATELAAQNVPGPAGTVLKVLTINTMFDCKNGIDKFADMIRGTGADLVGMQEVNRSTPILARKLGMHFVQQDKRTGLLSRFPIESTSPHRYAVTVKLDNGQKVAFCNAHLTSFPYQPHQLMHLNAGGGPFLNTEEEAIQSAENTRGKEVRTMIQEADNTRLPAIACGDFNEPSFHDWTPASVAAGQQPIKVDWPASRHYDEAGFTDSYREKFADEVAHPGNTWTPTTAPDDPTDHHDRIDFIHHRGAAIKLKDIQIVGENTTYADLVFTPYPSDHRGLLATFEVAPPAVG